MIWIRPLCEIAYRGFRSVFWRYRLLQMVSMTVSATKSGKYKQQVLYLKLLRVGNITYTKICTLPAPFKLFWNALCWEQRRLKGITADQNNKDPGLSVSVTLDIPDVPPLSFLFRSGCATLNLIEKLVGFEKNSSTQPSNLNHTSIR